MTLKAGIPWKMALGIFVALRDRHERMLFVAMEHDYEEMAEGSPLGGAGRFWSRRSVPLQAWERCQLEMRRLDWIPCGRGHSVHSYMPCSKARTCSSFEQDSVKTIWIKFHPTLKRRQPDRRTLPHAEGSSVRSPNRPHLRESLPLICAAG